MKFDDCYVAITFRNGITLNVFLQDLRDFFPGIDFRDFESSDICICVLKEKR